MDSRIQLKDNKTPGMQDLLSGVLTLLSLIIHLITLFKRIIQPLALDLKTQIQEFPHHTNIITQIQVNKTTYQKLKQI